MPMEKLKNVTTTEVRNEFTNEAKISTHYGDGRVRERKKNNLEEEKGLNENTVS